MNINFKQFDKSTYPYLDDSNIGDYIPVCYGKIAACKLTCVNSNEDTDNGSLAAIYRMPEGMSSYGTAYVKDNDTWKTATVSSVDYDTGLITISNGRSDSGSTYECKLVDCYGFIFDDSGNVTRTVSGSNSYPRFILQHWYSNYGNIEYTDSNFNKTEWESELDDTRFKCNIGFLLDDYSNDDNSTSTSLDYFNKVVYKISSMGGKMFARIDYDASGKITAKLKDYSRTSSAVFASSDIKNASELSGSTSSDSAYSEIIENYYKNYAESDDTYLSLTDSTYKQYVKQNFRITQSYTDDTLLINEADALIRAAEVALELKETPVKFTVDIYDDESSEQDVMGIRLYDVITVALSPDNLNASARTYAGNHDCLVVGVNPKLDDGYNEVTIQIIPDRTPSVQQAAVRTGAYTTVSRAKSSLQILADTVDDNLLLTGNLIPPSITVVADSVGNVSDFSAATGTFNVKYSGTDVTGNGPVYSVVSQTGCTGTIGETTGIYAVTALSADVGILLMRATYQGKTFETAFTVTKSYTGDTGITVSLTSDNIVFNYNSTPTPSSSEVVATIHNYTGTLFYEFSVDGTIKQNTESNTYTYTPKALYADMPDNIIVKVRKGTADGDIIAIDSLDMYAIKDGTDGTNGINSATVHLYQQASSAPAVPTATLTYTFATGALTGTLGSWSTTPPAASTTPTYMIIAVAASSGSTDTIATAEWSTPVIYTKTGTNGTNGTSITISSQAVTYQSSTSGTTTPTGTWLTSPPTVAEDNYLWTRTIVTYSDATSTTAYSVSYIGTNGINGMTFIQQNPSQSVPADSAGTVSSYTGTGNVLRVFEGSTELQAVTGTPAAGQYKVTAAGTNITAGSVTVSGKTAVVAVCSAMTSGTSVLKATVTYTITGVRTGGTAFSTTLTQSITKAVAGLDSTAITITNPDTTVPSTGMTYNNTYYGIYSGVWYKWSWSSTTTGSWAQASASTPPTPAVRYSFDEMPDLPDDSGATYKKDADFTTTSPWTAIQSTLSIVSGELVSTPTTTNNKAQLISSTLFNGANSGGKIVKIKVYSPVVTCLCLANLTNFTIYKTFNLNIGYNTISFIFPTDSYNYYLEAVTGSNSISLRYNQIYLGDGTTSQPIIDNVSGKYNASNTKILSSTGISGKCGYFPSRSSSGYFPTSFDITSEHDVTLSCWFKLPSSSNTAQVNMSILTTGSYTVFFGFYVNEYTHIVGIAIRSSTEYKTAYTTIDYNTWYNLAFVYEASTYTGYFYLNGVLKGSITLSSTTDNTFNSYMYIWGNNILSGDFSSSVQSGYIDDIRLWDKKLDASEMLGLYLQHASGAKLYTLADYNYDSQVSSWEIVSSVPSFTRARSGTVTPSSVTFSAKAVIASAAQSYSGRFIIYLNGSGSSSYMSSSDESSHAYAIPSGTTSMKIELYKAGSTTALVATKEFSIPYDGTVKPQYLGIGVLSATGTMAFTGATVDDSGVITPGSPVSAVITGDWMVGYVTSTMVATVYYWNGSAWTSTTDQKYVSVAAFDIMNLTTGGYTVANYTIIMNAIIKNLMVSNLKLLTGGKLFAGAGNYANSDTPIFLGYDTDGVAKFSLGNKFKVANGSAEFTGDVLSNKVRLQNDCFMPMVEFAQTYDEYTNFDVNLSTETASAIKTKLDNLINNDHYPVRLDYNDDTQLRSYVYVTSNDSSYRDVATGSMSDYYVSRYIDSSGNTIYVIGSVSSYYGFISTLRTLLSVTSGGTVQKFTSSTLSNNLHFSYRAKELGINAAGIFVGGTIESRNGYQFYEPSWFGALSGSRTYTGAEYFKYLRMLGVGSTPRLCCIKGTDSNHLYHHGIVYLVNSTLYRIELNTTNYEISNTGTTDTGIRAIMI